MNRQPTSPNRPTRTRKASKREAKKVSIPEETTRQRGRPRLDTNDQTTAERRRTQIRLAQRAYRRRKETTISSLNKRVASLEQTIQDMHKAFLDFQDEATVAGLRNWNPLLAGNLHRSAVTFADLAKNGVHEPEPEGEEVEIGQSGENSGDASLHVLSSRDLRPQLAKHEVDADQRKRQHGADPGLGTESIWGYSQTYEHLIVAPDKQTPLPNSSRAVEEVQMENWEQPIPDVSPTNENFQLYQVQVPEPAFHQMPLGFHAQSFFPMPSLLSTELSLPKSFANREMSFARRLVRSSLESAIQLLSSPSSTQEAKNHFCRFTFCYSNSSRILSVLKRMVARTSNENLESWQLPSYHHGGAGLHYPREGIDATCDPPENWAETGPVGPTFNYTPETDQFQGVERQSMIEQLQIDGEWFDSNDVEQYLKTKGLFLDGQSSIVEINESEDAVVPRLSTNAANMDNVSSPSNTLSSIGGPPSPQYDFVPANAVFYGNEDIFSAEALGYDDAVPDVDLEKMLGQLNSATTTFSDPKAINGQPDFDFNLSPQPYQTLNQNRLQSQSRNQPLPQAQLQSQPENQTSYFTLKSKKYLDVDRLIDIIVRQSVCLGRTPGFRRAIIDDALKAATTEGLAEMVMA